MHVDRLLELIQQRTAQRSRGAVQLPQPADRRRHRRISIARPTPARTACWSPTCRSARIPSAKSGSATGPLAFIRLVAPTTPTERMREIAAHGSGFVYLISRLGVTGARDDLAADLPATIEAIARGDDAADLRRLRHLDAEQARRLARSRTVSSSDRRLCAKRRPASLERRNWCALCAAPSTRA